MSEDLENKINELVEQDWTLEFGEDLDFEKNPYHYVRIKEIDEFVYCAKTKQAVIDNYKKQLRLLLKVALEFGDPLPVPGVYDRDDDFI